MSRIGKKPVAVPAGVTAAVAGQRVTMKGPNGELAFTCPDQIRVAAPVRARVLLLGGEPLDGPRHVWWNFVSSSQERLEQAKQDWKEGRFPKVPGDDVEFIPLPD